MITYKQSFWLFRRLSGDVGPSVRAKIAKAVLNLKYNQPDTILLGTSAGGYDASEKPVIALITPLKVDLAELSLVIQAALTKEGVVEELEILYETWFYDFPQDDLMRAERATLIQDLEKAKRNIDSLVDLPKVSIPSTNNDPYAQQVARLLLKDPQISADALAQDIPSSDVLQGFSVSAERYEEMKTAKGDAVFAQLKELEKGLTASANATKSNIAVAWMIITGITTAGEAMQTAYEAVTIAGDAGVMISGLIAAIGGLQPFRDAVSFVAACFAIKLVVKDAINELVMVNALSRGITVVEDYILSGERCGVTKTLSAAPDPVMIQKPMSFPAGLFTYRKARLAGQFTKFHGCTIGWACSIEDSIKSFSIGVDCPTSLDVNDNCFIVLEGSDAKKAAYKAFNTSHASEAITIRLDKVKCTVSRASATGSVNYGVCCISGNVMN